MKKNKQVCDTNKMVNTLFFILLFLYIIQEFKQIAYGIQNTMLLLLWFLWRRYSIYI